MLIFVYGTLKGGFCNHGVLGDATFMGNYTTPPVYRMFDLGAFPAISLDGTTAIIGEVYEIDNLDRVDVLEGYPTLYDRSEIPTNFGMAWVYHYEWGESDYHFIQKGSPQIIENGFWK